VSGLGRAGARGGRRAERHSPAQSAHRLRTLSPSPTSRPLHSLARNSARRLCLCIFLVLVYARGLAWEFSAEVATILLVEVALVALTLSNRNGVLPIWKASVACALFPGSLVVVWLLENVAGWQ
jgi:hypothetical protein